MRVKKHLGFSFLRAAIAQRIRQIDDPRQSGKVAHCLHDVLMSGFAMMFFQDLFLLTCQRRLHEQAQINNLRTVFDSGKPAYRSILV